jgi:hypothetical protein
MGGQGRWPMTAPAQRGITAMAAHDIEPGRPGEAKVSDGQTAALPLDRHGWHAGLESHLVPRTPGTTATAAAARPRTRAPGLGAPGWRQRRGLWVHGASPRALLYLRCRTRIHRWARMCSAWKTRTRLRWPPGRRWRVGTPVHRQQVFGGPGAAHRGRLLKRERASPGGRAGDRQARRQSGAG